MRRTLMAVWIGITAFALVGAAVYAAQRDDRGEEHRVRTMTLVNPGEGRARLGVRLTDVNADKARELKLPGESGALVTKVESDSPAAKAGLEANDVILEFDGERVRSVAELRRLVGDTPPDRTVSVKISRGGQVRTLNVKLEPATAESFTPEVTIPEFEMPEVHVPNFNFDFFLTGPRLGISAQELTPQLAQYFGVAQGKGVLVEEVESGSAAEKAGLKAGDCIVRVGDTKIESVDDLHRALREKSDEKREVNLTIVRDRHEQTLRVELEASPGPVLRHRIARDEYMRLDPAEMSHLRTELLAQRAALCEARLALEKQRHSLMQERRQMLHELRREFGRMRLETSSWVVD